MNPEAYMRLDLYKFHVERDLSTDLDELDRIYDWLTKDYDPKEDNVPF